MASAGGGGGSYWIRNTGDIPYALTTDSSLNIYTGGYINQGSGAGDAWIHKLDADGVEQWKTACGSNERDEINDLVLDSSGNLYGLGNLTTGSSTKRGILKLNSSTGAFIFKKSYNATPYTRRGEGGTIDSNDKIFIGSNDNFNEFNTSGGVSAGKFKQNAYRIHAMTVDSNDNLLILDGAYGLDVMKVNPSNSYSISWFTYLGSGSPTDDNAQDIAVDTNDDVYAVGWNNYGAMITKTSSSGTGQWQKRYGSSGDRFYSVACDSQDNVYACGYTSQISGQGYACQLVKWNSSGTVQWQRFFSTGSGTVDLGYQLHIDANDDLVIAIDGNAGYIARIPTDGTLTGTYSGNLWSTVTYGTDTTTIINTGYNFVAGNTSLGNMSTTTYNLTLTEFTPSFVGSGPEPL